MKDSILNSLGQELSARSRPNLRRAVHSILLASAVIGLASFPSHASSTDNDNVPTLDRVQAERPDFSFQWDPIPNPRDLWPDLEDSYDNSSSSDSGGSGGGDGTSRDAGDDCAKGGNPIIFSTGNKIEEETDFTSSGTMPLTLERTYNHYWKGVGVFGKHWVSNVDLKLTFGTTSVNACYPRPGGGTCSIGSSSFIYAWRSDGSTVKYTKAADGVFYEDITDPVSRIVVQNGEFNLHTRELQVEHYSSAGYLSSIKNESGIGWTLDYNSTYLHRVTHTSGRYIEFNWTDGKLTAVRDPGASYYGYAYTANAFGTGLHRLVASSRPGTPMATSVYHYEDARDPTALTGKSFDGVRFSQFAYDDDGYAVSTEHNGAGKYSYVYTPDGAELTVLETNPLGKQTTYDFVDGKMSTITGHASLHCAASGKGNSYDANGNLDIVIDNKGNKTNYDYNDKGQLIKKVEAYGTALARTTDYVWDTNVHRIKTVTLVGSYQAEVGYGTDNRLSSIKLTNLAAGGVPNQQRTTSYTYTLHPNGMVKTAVVDGPIAGDADAVTTTYNASGDVTEIKNAIGYGIVYSNFDGRGQPQRETGVNGAITDTVYDARGRKVKSTAYVDGLPVVSTWIYDKRDLLVSTTPAGGPTRSYHYDVQRRLVAEYEPEVGGTFAYRKQQYDNASNVTVSEIYRLASAPADPFPYDLRSATDSEIRGYVDGVFRHTDGLDYISGWACSSGVNDSIRAHVYVGGPAGTPPPTGAGVANVLASAPSEGAVASACSAFGTQYRFRILVTAAMLQQHAGKPIYVHGISPFGTGNDLISNSGLYRIPGGGGGGGGGGPETPPGCPTPLCHVPITSPEDDPSEVSAVPVAGTTGDLFWRSFTDYDELGRVRARRGNDGQLIKYAYDLNGNVETVTDVGATPDRITRLRYDSLDRVDQSTDAATGVTGFKYDAGDRLIEVKDPRNLLTKYTYDGFNQLWKVVSPDTGTTTFAFNAVGQKTSLTRQDGSVLNYDYDVELGRLIRVRTPDASVYRRFVYDACTNGKGLLCSAYVAVSNVVETKADFTYTPHGQLSTRLDKASGFIDTTTYHYDGFGRLDGIGYPSGVAVGYGYTLGRLSAMTANLNGTQVNVATGLRHEPFGSVSSWTYGNGLERTYNYDLDGRLTGISTVKDSTVHQSLTYAFDASNLIEALTNGTDASNSHTYQYDSLSRLTKDTLGGGAQIVDDGFDAVGNRTTRSSTAAGVNSLTQYTIAPTSNRMLVQDGNAHRDLVYTPQGNLLSSTGWQGNRTYDYDAFDRLKSVTIDGAVSSYAINALDQRVAKTNAGGTKRYVYSGQNQLLAQTTPTGWKSYLWLGNELVGVVQPSNALSYVHTDHLGRPEVATNAARQVVWKAVNASYHRFVSLDTIGGIIAGFPGQYWDEDTGTWYNGFRDYDPYLGRYIQSDPIGLDGGLNTYAYAGSNPVSNVDPLGLLSLGSTDADCKGNAVLNGIAQATPYLGLGLAIADQNLTPLGNGSLFADSPATDFDKGSGVASTIAERVASPMGERFANDIINSRFYDHSNGNRTERKFQRNIDRHVTWGTAKQAAKYAGRALGIVGVISALVQGAEDWQACKCEAK